MGDFIRLQGLEIRAGAQVLVRDTALEMSAGEILALVGASGSGKTLTARSLVGLPGPNPGVVAADLLLRVHGVEHRPYSGLERAGRRSHRQRLQQQETRFRRIRGGLLGYLPQDARGALNPIWSVQRLVQESIRLAGGVQSPSYWLERAGFAAPAEVLPLFAHQLSGGMAQRVCIALTLARGSRFLIADEPTTGLDPTVQEEILTELRRSAAEGVGVLLITHDLRLVPRLAKRVVIMHAGRVVERLAADSLDSAQSAEARELLRATARIAGGQL